MVHDRAGRRRFARPSSAPAWRSDDIDLFEINEAFAVVALACMRELGIAARAAQRARRRGRARPSDRRLGRAHPGHPARRARRAGRTLRLRRHLYRRVDGEARVKGAPDRSVSLGELARKANPLRGAVKPGTIPGLESSNYFGPERGATASGVHAMIVEVQPDTMLLDIKKFVVVHDCGNVINPLILDGQIHGGVAQGIGNAFYEQLIFDENGQLLTGSFMDFLLPTALDVPRMSVGHETTPSPLNPLGVKGAGEAGAIPVGPLFAQAIENALNMPGLEILEIPLSPNRLWELVQKAKGG